MMAEIKMALNWNTDYEETDIIYVTSKMLFIVLKIT